VVEATLLIEDLKLLGNAFCALFAKRALNDSVSFDNVKWVCEDSVHNFLVLLIII
jgi:hypothetical protein